MKVNTKQVNLKIITAEKNMVLTNGQTYSSSGGHIYLGCNDSPDNWYEITTEEYNKLIEEQENENDLKI